MNQKNHYIVVYTETSESCDGKARELGTYPTFEDAEKATRDDMECYIQSFMEDDDDISENDFDLIDYENWEVVVDDDCGCSWSIIETE